MKRRWIPARVALAAASAVALAAVTLSPQQADASPGSPAAPARVPSAASDASLAGTLVAALGGAAAGSYYDSTLGRLVVDVTDGRAADLVRAAGAAPRVVEHSKAELDSAHATLDSRITTPGTAWAADPRLNQVVLTADPTVTAADLVRIKDTARSLGSAVVVKRSATKLTRFIAGGDGIWGSQYRCSLGFNVKRAGKPDAFVTAGHCGKVEADWRASNAGPVIARTEAATFPGRDYAIAAYPSTGAVDHPSAVNPGLKAITGAGAATVGQAISRSGSSTGLKTGTVTALNATVNYKEGQVTGLIETSACAEGGDSGGPLFAGTLALGVLSGGSGSCAMPIPAPRTYFQPVQEILTAYGATIP
ncbi:S1 family peptidase [Streptomyces roseoverticillatus]|uniref:S1 family peptidase n=1 Tax=Streptomyces roseoverticillatus TaxID=66429 RepID=UPI001F1D47B4|nr:S1 family peptidase [Streptomyces roseoverticillatus]